MKVIYLLVFLKFVLPIKLDTTLGKDGFILIAEQTLTTLKAMINY
jgi:hypothetical protein